MKLITRDTDYAVRALIFIAERKKEIVSVSQLVKALGIPQPFLRKLLQILNKKRILKSYKGSGGGFSLLRPAEKISLLDLIKIFQGSLKLNECLLKKKVCPNINICLLRYKLGSIERYVVSRLKPITIATLLIGRHKMPFTQISAR